MKKRIKEVIKSLADKADASTDKPEAAVKFSQAALNLAHTLSIVTEIKKREGEI